MKNNRGLTFIEILIVLTLIMNLNSVFGATIQVVELPEIIDESKNTVYGISFPGAKFFSFHIPSRKTHIITTLNTSIPVGEHTPLISKALVRDAYGNIYANIDMGYLVRFAPSTGKLDTLNVQIPGLAGREVFNRIDSATLHPSGDIYGGTRDGYLFCFSPETAGIRNLGKPLMETRIRALTVGDDGNVYGVGGEDFGVGRLFTYKPGTAELVDLGIMDVAIVPYFEWKGLVFDSMVTGQDGSIYIGNSEHRSRLFIYNP